jgi:membrane peptidoglycan carboxypeptidase
MVGRNVVRLAGACVLAGVLLAALLSPVVLSGGAAAARLAASAAQITPAAVTGDVPLVTTLTDRNGNPIATVFDQYRLPVTAARIAPVMKAAIVSVEDRRFYTEGGVDPSAVVRALVHDLSGGSTQGGSTISQQFVKNYLINVTDRDDPAAQDADRADTLARKIREARTAIELDESMSKDDVLAGYLNVVEFTGRVYGVEAAAHAYFDTTAANLTLPQAALLAGMVNSPTQYDPYAHPAAAIQRRNTVLDAMVATHAIDTRTATAAKKTTLGVRPGEPAIPASTCAGALPDAGFLCQYALSYLRTAGLTADDLATGGYTIRTTLDPKASHAAKHAVDANVPPAQDGVANTMAIIAPGTSSHEVLAMVANRTPGNDIARGETSRNLVADVSDPFGAGSVFKIFTSAAALESGDAGLHTELPNPGDACFPQPGSDSCYPVQNDGHYPDPITLADGLATSPNTAFVGLETRVGMPAVLDMARRLGLRNTLRTNDAGTTPAPHSADPLRNQPQSRYFRDKPSFTLGDSPVSPLELANVSATLMSGGTWCPPDPIRSVTDRFGRAVQLPQTPCEPVVPPGLAHTLMSGLSQDTVSGTTAASARAAGWTRPGIGKTGTTQESESVAFVGGTGGYAVSSLVFADGPNPGELCPGPPVYLGDCGNGAFGGTVAAPPYFQAMAQILAGRPDQPVPPPDPAYL